jgi:hypothetical protein
MFVPRMPRFWAVLLLCLTAVSLHGQPGNGFSVREQAGVVFVKPQPWSKDTEVTVFEFQAFINRTADGRSGAGYYEFRTKNADRRQVPTARIVKLIVYPDLQQFKEIVRLEDRRVLTSRIEELRSTVAKFPSSRTYLEPFIAKLSDEVSRYDSGQVKTEGVWTTRDAYIKRAATKLASLLQVDIARASPPSSLNLDDDPKFVRLKELAGGNSDARQVAAEVSAQFEALVRAEKRTDLLARLSRQDTLMPEAKAAFKELKALNPNEDPKSAAFIKAWDSGTATVERASAQAQKIAAGLERELARFTVAEAPPEISPEIERQIFALRGTITGFLATNPPIQFANAVQRDLAVCAVGEDFGKLRAIFKEKHYLDAKDVLDNLARHADLVGPETMRVVSGLQRQAVEKIEQFTRLRGEGKLLADSGKKPEALAKFEAAFTVIPDSEIERQISLLKADALDVSSKGQ